MTGAGISHVKQLKERREKCDKKSGHTLYQISVTDDELKHSISSRFGENTILNDVIEKMVALTGMITVKFNSRVQPLEGYGTGFIQRIRHVRGKCPCPKRHDVITRYAILSVATVVHVFDEDPGKAKEKLDLQWEPKNVEMVLDYDKEEDDLSECPKLYGLRPLDMDKDVDPNWDWCCIEFVTHDEDLAVRLKKTLVEFQDLQKKVYGVYKGGHKDNGRIIMIGHPHGGPKKYIHIAGKATMEILKEVRDSQRWGRYKYKAPTCQGLSGSQILILGQPICGFGYWFGHPHNHSGKVKDNTEIWQVSSIGVEHIEY